GNVEPAYLGVEPTESKPRRMSEDSLTRGHWVNWRESAAGKLEVAKADLERLESEAKRYETGYKSPDGTIPVWARDALLRLIDQRPAKQAAFDEAQKIAADPEAAAIERWGEIYDREPHTETDTHHLIGGAVLRYWGQVRPAMDGIHLAQDTATGARVVGVRIRQSELNGILAQIGGGAATVTPSQMYEDVLRN